MKPINEHSPMYQALMAIGVDVELARQAIEECRDRTTIPADVTTSALYRAPYAVTAMGAARRPVRPWSPSVAYLPSWNGKTYETQTRRRIAGAARSNANLRAEGVRLWARSATWRPIVSLWI